MAQIKYKTSFKLGNPDKDENCKIYIRVTGDGKDIKVPTTVKINPEHFANGQIKGPDKKRLNAIINSRLDEIEEILTNSVLHDTEVTPHLLAGKQNKNDNLRTYSKKILLQKRAKGTRDKVASIFDKLPDTTFSNVKGDFLHSFEKKLRKAGLDVNTINTQMKQIKQLILSAVDDKLIDQKSAEALRKYKVPPYVQKIPEYLTIPEIDNFTRVVKALKDEAKKRSGYYFLLSCYTGWRLADLMSFDYDERVKDGMVRIRAGKNNKVVSIPIYAKLEEVLNFCKENKLGITEEHFRLFVKGIAKDIGINQKNRNIKIHTARHTFAMMLIDKGFSIDEVAELLGDSVNVARIYARITNSHLSKKILEAFK